MALSHEITLILSGISVTGAASPMVQGSALKRVSSHDVTLAQSGTSLTGAVPLMVQGNALKHTISAGKSKI